MPARKVSNQEKQLRGSFREDRAHKVKAITASGTPKPSPWLSKDAKKEFRRICQVIADAGQDYLSALDTGVLEAYATSYASWVEAEKMLQTKGSIEEIPVFNRSSGNQVGTKLVPSPWLRISKERQAAMVKAAAALGFDPRSRSGSLQSVIPEPSTPKKAPLVKPVAAPIRESDMIAKLKAEGLL